MDYIPDKDEKDIHDIMIEQGVSYGSAKTRLRVAEILSVVVLGGGLLIALACALISSLYSAVTATCDHENLDMDSARIDVLDGYAYIDCNDCGDEKRLDVGMTKKISTQPTCQYPGRQTLTWYIKDFPEITRVTYTELPCVDCVVSRIYRYGKEATCTAEGLTDSGYCTWCGDFVEAKVIEKKPHKFILQDGIAPTCTKPGTAAYNACTVCGFVEAEGAEIPKLAHEFVSGVHEAAYNIGSFKGELCTLCGNPGEIEEIYGEPLINQYFEYTVNEEENYITITEVLQEADEMVIPDTINGIPVKYMAEALFRYSRIKKITLSENLVEIPANAFAYCYSLQSVNIPDSATAIGNSAFKDCHDLTHLTIENASIGHYAFEGCRSLRTVEMGLNSYEIGYFAFRDCVRLIYVKLSDKATRYTVEPDAFQNTACYYASIPAKSGLDQTISRDICHCVEYANYNDLIEETDGFYYDRKSGTLIAIDNETGDVVIPDRVDALSQKFYVKCKNPIFSIVIPSTVKTIPDFQSKYQNLPFRANYLNTGKVKVYYTGTEAEWEQIEGGVFLRLFDAYYVDGQGNTVLVSGEWFEMYHTGEWEYSQDGSITIKQAT